MNTVATDQTETLAAVELRRETANLPAITEDRPLVALANADRAKAERVTALMREANIKDTNSLVTFGASANRELTSLSEQILGNARNKEFGAAGDFINNMVAEIRGFDPKDVGQGLSWWQRVIKKITPLMKAIQRYEAVQSHLHTISGNLDKQKTALMKHIALQDRMEASSHKALDAIEDYIAAGEAVIASWTENELAEAEQAKGLREGTVKIILQIESALGVMRTARKTTTLGVARLDCEPSRAITARRPGQRFPR